MNSTDYELAKKILKKYNQEHLIYFYDELSECQKDLLINQILSINFEEIISLYNNSMKDEPFDINSISPLEHFEKSLFSNEELSYYNSLGQQELLKNSYAVVTMAGGQGTRLGYKGPKGTFMVDLISYKKSLFEIICDDIKKANKLYNITIPWYIMTSIENDLATKTFFENNNYFNYPKEKIHFFKQDKLPLIDIDGKLILQEPYIIKEASNGNGNVFFAMKKSGILDELEKQKIQWVFFGGIDNILIKNVDSIFLGLTIDKKEKIASKSIFKEKPLENLAVYCRKDGKPSILYYDNIDIETSEKKDANGKYLYREANMLAHLMHIEAIKKISEIKLPYHRAFKKNAFVNYEGVKQVPDKPNSFKFENFIFDAFSHFDNMILLRVDENEEFAPIKSYNGTYTPETARQKYLNYYNKN